MSPCSPNDVSLNIPSGPSGPSIPGFGSPFTLDLPNINPFPAGFPEDLLDLLNKLQMLIPPGALLPQLNPNFGKDIFDAIMKLLDQFMPFLMLYKFFLPILNIILCIIEVICVIPDPFRLPGAIIKLFTVCIPAFLALFPIFALILMIIALILLILALIEYIILKILELILLILRNIAALVEAFQEGSVISVLAIAKKLGASLCIFQNLFVLLAIFAIIIQIIKDILGMVFAIPPCDDSPTSSDSSCCNAEVCPGVVKGPFSGTTATLAYLPGVSVETDVELPPPTDFLKIPIRTESWQLYDFGQIATPDKQFVNIINSPDITPDPLTYSFPFFKPVFFPMAITYTNKVTASQAPYSVDLRLFYNPAQWGRAGAPRFIRFKDCIVSVTPTATLNNFENLPVPIPTGVISIVGGVGYEDDGKTQLFGYDASLPALPIIPEVPANLENFLHKPTVIADDYEDDGINITDIEYTFKPNTKALIGAGIITPSCDPLVALNKNFVNNVFAGDVALKTQNLKDLLNSPTFPDPAAAQECLSTALTGLRTNLTVQGVANFQATALTCLNKLKDDANTSLAAIIGLGFEACQSSFSVTPTLQFTSKPIVIKLDMKERNGQPITTGIPQVVADVIAPKIKAHATFGEVSPFAYDGYQSFLANLTSAVPGAGQLMLSFDNNILCTNTVNPPVHSLQTVDYQFIYTPSGLTIPVPPVGVGDQSEGQPRRDEGDQSGGPSGSG
jgi:hypothetical protein